MANGERAATQSNQMREVGSRRAGLRGWWNRGWFVKWLTKRKERRIAKREIRLEMEDGPEILGMSPDDPRAAVIRECWNTGKTVTWNERDGLRHHDDPEDPR